jgi:hypothetical protein
LANLFTAKILAASAASLGQTWEYGFLQAFCFGLLDPDGTHLNHFVKLRFEATSMLAFCRDSYTQPHHFSASPASQMHPFDFYVQPMK